MAEPPYGIIADLLKKGQVVPFLGAGVNFGTRPAGATWETKISSFLPSGAELSLFLAKKSNFPSKETYDLTDLSKVASFFVETSARGDLREYLHDVFNRQYDPCDIHTYLAEIARSRPLLIVTTNYDDLTEQAFAAAQPPVPYDLVIHPTDRQDVAASVLWWEHGTLEPHAVLPNDLWIDLATTSVIYKMHGTVDRQKCERDSYVITEEDYVDFLSRMTRNAAVPAQFMQHFATHRFLFLGYGLRDWNLRVVLRNLRNILPAIGKPVAQGESEEPRSWAIQFRPSELEIELWNARRVKIFDVDINECVKQLRKEGM